MGRAPLTGDVELARISAGEGCAEADAGVTGSTAERGSSVCGWARRVSLEGRSETE